MAGIKNYAPNLGSVPVHFAPDLAVASSDFAEVQRNPLAARACAHG